MKRREIVVTSDQLNRFMTDIRAVQFTVGEHLELGQKIRYAKDLLSTEEMDQLDRHLYGCTKCTIEIEEFYENPAALQRAVISLLNSQLAIAFTSAMLVIGVLGKRRHLSSIDKKGETDWISFRWRIKSDQADNLIISFASHELALEGESLRLTAGDWERELTLKRMASDQVGVVINVTKEERKQIPVDAPLLVKLVNENLPLAEISLTN
jgi:hypothetical protein